MENELQWIIPRISEFIIAGLSIWDNLIKPCLERNKYPISKELEDEFRNMESNKDKDSIENKIKELINYSNQLNIHQTANGINVAPVAVGDNNQGAINIIFANQPNDKIVLSAIELTMLKEISLDEFRTATVFTDLTNNFRLNANCKELAPPDIDRNIEVKSAFENLLEIGFISQTSKNKYQITSKGLNYLNV